MALGLVAGGGRLGFKKRWGRDEGWVVYGFEGGSAGSFSVFLVCGSELCGSNWESGSEWEMKWWEGGSEKWGWSAKEMSRSDWEMSWSDWEMEKGNSPCVERIGCVREMGLSVWHEGDGGARCVDRGLESSVCVECMWESRRKMFEVKMRTEFIFRPRSLILWSNWKYFQFDPIFRTYQTCYFLEKDFWILFEVKTNGALIEVIFSFLSFSWTS